MKALILLASFPKSGNTLLRSALLSALGQFQGFERLLESSAEIDSATLQYGSVSRVIEKTINGPKRQCYIFKTHLPLTQSEYAQFDYVIFIRRDRHKSRKSLVTYQREVHGLDLSNRFHNFIFFLGYPYRYEEIVDSFSTANDVIVEYEDLLNDPRTTLERISKSCRLDLCQSDVREVSEKIINGELNSNEIVKRQGGTQNYQFATKTRQYTDFPAMDSGFLWWLLPFEIRQFIHRKMRIFQLLRRIAFYVKLIIK